MSSIKNTIRQRFFQWEFMPLSTDKISHSKVLNNSISIIFVGFVLILSPVQMWKNHSEFGRELFQIDEPMISQNEGIGLKLNNFNPTTWCHEMDNTTKMQWNYDKGILTKGFDKTKSNIQAWCLKKRHQQVFVEVKRRAQYQSSI